MNIAQIKQDLDNGVIVSAATWRELVEWAVKVEGEKSNTTAGFEDFWTNPNYGDNSSIERCENGSYVSFLTREAYRAWLAGRGSLATKNSHKILHGELFSVYSDVLSKRGYNSIQADSYGLMAVAEYALAAIDTGEKP